MSTFQLKTVISDKLFEYCNSSTLRFILQLKVSVSFYIKDMENIYTLEMIFKIKLIHYIRNNCRKYIAPSNCYYCWF